MYMLKRKYMYNILLFKKKEEKMSGFQMLCIVDFQDRRERINESVSHEVQSIFKGKTTNQLLLLEEQIKKKLQGGEGVDVGQWMRWHHYKNGRMSLIMRNVYSKQQKLSNFWFTKILMKVWKCSSVLSFEKNTLYFITCI